MSNKVGVVINFNFLEGKMATEGSRSTEGKELTKRERVFLGELPADFLRVQEVPRAEQSTHGGQR